MKHRYAKEIDTLVIESAPKSLIVKTLQQKFHLGARAIVKELRLTTRLADSYTSYRHEAVKVPETWDDHQRRVHIAATEDDPTKLIINGTVYNILDNDGNGFTRDSKDFPFMLAVGSTESDPYQSEEAAKAWRAPMTVEIPKKAEYVKGEPWELEHVNKLKVIGSDLDIDAVLFAGESVQTMPFAMVFFQGRIIPVFDISTFACLFVTGSAVNILILNVDEQLRVKSANLRFQARQEQYPTLKVTGLDEAQNQMVSALQEHRNKASLIATERALANMMQRLEAAGPAPDFKE